MIVITEAGQLGVRTYGGVDRYLRCLKRGEVEFSSGRKRCESIGSGMRRQMRRMNRECMQKQQQQQQHLQRRRMRGA